MDGCIKINTWGNCAILFQNGIWVQYLPSQDLTHLSKRDLRIVGSLLVCANASQNLQSTKMFGSPSTKTQRLLFSLLLTQTGDSTKMSGSFSVDGLSIGRCIAHPSKGRIPEFSWEMKSPPSPGKFGGINLSRVGSPHPGLTPAITAADWGAAALDPRLPSPAGPAGSRSL